MKYIGCIFLGVFLGIFFISLLRANKINDLHAELDLITRKYLHLKHKKGEEE
jgi:hypothetical protein